MLAGRWGPDDLCRSVGVGEGEERAGEGASGDGEWASGRVGDGERISSFNPEPPATAPNRAMQNAKPKMKNAK
jgi:hypothetical protein